MRYTKQQMLRLLKMKVKELGRFPKKKEINEDPLLPSSETYRTHFGNLPQLAEAIGLPASYSRRRKKYSPSELLLKLSEIGKKLGRMPTKKDIDRARELPCISTIIRHLGPLYLLSKKLKLPSQRKAWRFEDDERLLELLKLKADEVGRAPTATEMRKDKRLPSVKTYKRRFGSYASAIRLIGYTPRERKRKESIPFSEFKEKLLNFYHKHNRLPSAIEFMKVCRYYLVELPDGRRAKWNQLINMCGLPILTRTHSMRLHRKAELFIKSILTQEGCTVVDTTLMSAHSPYDLLVDNSIQVQVSASTLHKKSKERWRFNVPRQEKLNNFHYLVAVGYNEKFEEEAVFVFPRSVLRANSIMDISRRDKESNFSRFRIKELKHIRKYLTQTQ
jgi:hypothetical protein